MNFAEELAAAEMRQRERLYSAGLCANRELSVRYGKNGQQKAVFLREMPSGQLEVRKWLKNSGRWTNPISISPMAVLSVGEMRPA